MINCNHFAVYCSQHFFFELRSHTTCNVEELERKEINGFDDDFDSFLTLQAAFQCSRSNFFSLLTYVHISTRKKRREPNFWKVKRDYRSHFTCSIDTHIKLSH